MCSLIRAIRGELITPPDQVLAGVAAEQHGVVTRAQLLDAGVSDDAIDRRVKAGRLLRVHRGVYAVGHLPPSPHARAMAAVLACGPHALLSHRSAGALYGLIRHDTPIDVTAPTMHSHRGIAVHRSRSAERTIHYGIPVTTPTRTLTDLARVLDPDTLTRAINEARLRSLVTDGALTIAGLAPTDAPTRSVFEDAFLKFVARYDLPRPEVNPILHGYRVDMLWRAERLIVELDGRYHEGTFEADRERDAHLLAHGFATLRITWTRLTGRPGTEARRLRSLLARAKD